MKETRRSEILKNISRGVVRKPEVRPYSEISSPTGDVLHQLEANLSQLENLHGRLSFVLSEVRSVIRR